MKWIKVVNEFDAKYEVLVSIIWLIWPVGFSNSLVLSARRLGNDGTLFYFLTNKDAPREKIITIDIADPKFTRKDLVPEQKDAKLEDADIIGDKLVIVYKRDVRGLPPSG